MIDSTTTKSAFTPVHHRQAAIRSPLQLFEQSPMIKNMLFSAIRLQQPMDNFLVPQSSTFPIRRMISPAYITPSAFLRRDIAEPVLFHEPTSFSLDIVIPQRQTSMLAESPFSKETDQNGGSTDEEDSTLSSHPIASQPDEPVSADQAFSSKINLEAFLGKPKAAPIDEITIDLNIQVDNILRKQKIKHSKPIPKHHSGIKIKRKRFRKDRGQQDLLLAAFEANINRDKPTIKRLS